MSSALQFYQQSVACLFCLCSACLIVLALSFPANQVESDLSAVRNEIETSKVFNPDVLPDGTSYVFLTRDFKLKKSNMPDNLQEESLLNYQFKNVHGGNIWLFSVI